MFSLLSVYDKYRPYTSAEGSRDRNYASLYAQDNAMSTGRGDLSASVNERDIGRKCTICSVGVRQPKHDYTYTPVENRMP